MLGIDSEHTKMFQVNTCEYQSRMTIAWEKEKEMALDLNTRLVVVNSNNIPTWYRERGPSELDKESNQARPIDCGVSTNLMWRVLGVAGVEAWTLSEKSIPSATVHLALKLLPLYQ